MKLVTYSHNEGGNFLGALIESDEAVIDLYKAKPEKAFRSMISLIEAGAEALGKAKRIAENPPRDSIIGLEKISLQTPVPDPPQVRDFLCFEEHLIKSYENLRHKRAALETDPAEALKRFEEQGLFQIPSVFYQQPIFYKANRLSVIGTEQDILWPDYAEVMDFELEFGFFVGKQGKNISKDKARDHIFGYSIFNDISARDAQAIEMPGGLGPGKGKDFDTGNVIGPCIVTADEFDPYDCTMTARINGEEWSRGHSSSMHWSFEDLIAHISRSETIYPGEFFGSGTVGGGCGLELQRFLNDGDVMELEVEGIGVLRNKITRHR